MSDKTRFLVSRKHNERREYILGISGKKLIMHSGDNPFADIAEYSVNMNDLMNDSAYLDALPLSQPDTTLVMLDVLVRYGPYCKLDGRMFKFSLAA